MASQNGVATTSAKRLTQRCVGRFVPTCVLLLGIAGCARRAPGPEECHELGLFWVLGPRAHAVESFGEAADTAIRERTTECLTTPYDREVVQCVTAGAPARRCFGAFQSRRRALGAGAAR